MWKEEKDYRRQKVSIYFIIQLINNNYFTCNYVYMYMLVLCITGGACAKLLDKVKSVTIAKITWNSVFLKFHLNFVLKINVTFVVVQSHPKICLILDGFVL